MDFLFPDNTIKAWKGPVQARHRKYFTRDLPAAHMTGGAGVLMVQGRDHDSFHIQMQVLQCHRPYALTPYVRQTRVVLFYMLEGGFGYRLHRNLRVRVRAGHYCLFVLPSGAPGLPVLWPDPGYHASFHIEFPPSFFKAVMRETDAPDSAGEDKRRSRITPISPVILSIIDDIRHCPEEGARKALYLDVRVRMLLLQYLRDSQGSGGKPPFYPLELMDAADLYIREHLGEMITIETLAGHFHLSRSTLRRYFLEFFGMPVQRYVFQQRMTWARELLEQGGATISAVATETGFMDTSSFTRAFTRYYGHPPSYFRKR